MNSIKYTPTAQDQIDGAENKLSDALQSLRNKKSATPEVEVEIVPTVKQDVEIEIESPREEKRRSEFVKTDDPKVIERINDLYGQVKKSDARNQMILDHNRLMEEKLAEYQNKLSEFEKSTKNRASDQVETELKVKLRQAREEHDLDSIEQIEDKLLDLRLEKRISSKIPQERPIPQINPVQQQVDQELIHKATYLKYLSDEKDSQGNPIRPYLNDWHPDNRKAVDLFVSIPKEFEAAGKQADIKTVMEVLDERMQGKRNKSPTSVLSGDGGDIPERRTVRLTEDELYVAKRMGLKPEAYARQKQLLGR